VTHNVATRDYGAFSTRRGAPVAVKDLRRVDYTVRAYN